MVNKEKVLKVAKYVGTGVVAVGLIAGTIYGAVQKNEVTSLRQDVNELNQKLNSSLTREASTQEIALSLQSVAQELGLTVINLSEQLDLKDSEVIGLQEDILALQLEAEQTTAAGVPQVFVGFDKTFGLGEKINVSLTDNKFAKLADYDVSVDGEDISVEETLSVIASFDKEGEVSLTFDEGSIKYTVEYDNATGAVISEDDPLVISLFGEQVEIIKVEDNKLTIKSVEDKFLKEGESFNGVEIVRIGEDSVIVSVDGKTEVIDKNSTDKVNGIEVEVGAIFYTSGSDTNIVNIKAGAELEKVYKTTGDDKYFDQDEQWAFTTIESGKLVISNAEEFEAVQSVSLPNKFAELSFDLDEAIYTPIKVEKDDGNITKVHFELEDFDSTFAELEGGNWVPEDDEEVINFTAGVALKNSDFKLFANTTSVWVENAASSILVKVEAGRVEVDGSNSFDNDENFTSIHGLIVKPTEDFVDEEDESLEILVPEEAVEATFKVE